MEAQVTVHGFNKKLLKATARKSGNANDTIKKKTSSNVKIPIKHWEVNSSAALARYLSQTGPSLEFPSASTNSCLSEWSPLERTKQALEGDHEY